LIASHVSYEAFSTPITIGRDTIRILIELEPTKSQLNEVVVKSNYDEVWNDQLSRFKNDFLGGQFGHSCQILNPWVIDFSQNRDELVAHASAPLEIMNNALGYHLTFHLIHFQGKTKRYFIQGHTFFEPLEGDQASMKTFEANRAKAYYNSSQAIFQSIVRQTWKKEGYDLYVDKPGYEKTRERSNVFSKELDKTLERFVGRPGQIEKLYRGGWLIKLKGRLEVHHTAELAPKKIYSDVIYPVSWIESSSGIIRLDSLGRVVNPSEVSISGYLDQFRVGGLLPVNYSPSEAVQLSVWATLPSAKFARLQEKVFIHTNKSYYYPGEVVWLKGYIMYAHPQLQDSLSRVLYVELIDPDKDVVVQEQFLIDSGRVQGQLILDEAWAAGKYLLRAYTRWMLNYPAQDIFTKELPILEFNEALRQTSKRANVVNENVAIIPEKQSYRPRERVDVTVKVKLPAPSNGAVLSVSVLDTDLVDPIVTGPNIDDVFQSSSVPKHITTLKVTHPIEYGISVVGTYQAENKRRKGPSTLIVMQGDREEIAQVTTTDRGDFFLSGFNFYDTSVFSIRSLDQKGIVRLARKPIPPIGRTDLTTEYVIEKVNNYYHPQAEYVKDNETRMLDEVVVTAAPIDRERTKMAIHYGRPDHVLTGDQLRSGAVGPNLTEALAGKIPGLSVTTSYDNNGVRHYHVRIRGGTSSFGFTGTIEPLVLVDGVPFASRFDDQNTIGDFLVGLSPEAVDFIEVITRANPLFGVNGTNGVIIIYTKKGATVPNTQTSKSDSTSATQTFKVKGYTRALQFKAPNYGQQAATNERDFRSTIYWNPGIPVDRNGNAQFSFYASDNLGTYRIQLVGATLEGLPFCQETSIVISK